jgi:hypothetical protein
MALFVGTTMWFWIFYRAYHDGGALIVRPCCWLPRPCRCEAPVQRRPRALPSPRSPLSSLSPPNGAPIVQGLHHPWEAHGHGDHGHGEEGHEEELH